MKSSAPTSPLAPLWEPPALAGVVLLPRGDGRRWPGRQARPASLERRYTSALLSRQAAVHNVLTEALDDALKRMPGLNERARGDSIDGDLRRLLRVVDTVRIAVGKREKPSTATIEGVAAGVDAAAGAALTKQVQSVYGIRVVSKAATEELIGAWVSENVSLIKSIDARYFDEIEAAVVDAVKSGKSTRDLVKLIESRYGVARSRAQLIAVDQLGTINAKITQAKQVSIGIKGYKWSDSNDSRVRPLHVLLNGERFTWAEGHPTEGHPGEPIRCRCVAIPDFDAA